SYPDGNGKIQVTTEGGSGTSWPRKARELFFLNNDGRLNSSAVGPGPTFAAPRPFVAGKLPSVCGDVAPDGQRFLNCFPVADATAGGTQLVLDWPAGLQK